MDKDGFLVVDQNGRGHLPTMTDGKPDHRLMGAAWAALHGGYRGNKYEGPEKEKATEKLLALYKREGVEPPVEGEAKESFVAVELIAEDSPLGSGDAEGWNWDCEMLRPGTSQNGFHYTREFIAHAAKEFEGAPAFADHQGTTNVSTKSWIGNWRGLRVENGVLKGTLKLLKSEGWMRDKLKAAQEAGALPGISISMIAGLKKCRIGDRDLMQPQLVIPNTPRSADVVMFPSAGGRVMRAVAGSDFESALDSARERYTESGSAERGKWRSQEMETQGTPTREEFQALETKLAVSESRLLVNDKLAASKLPALLQSAIREEFENREITAEGLDKSIARHRTTYAAFAPSGIRPTGGPAQVVLESQDKLQIALDKFCGVRQSFKVVRSGALQSVVLESAYGKDVPSFEDSREAYIAFTGDKEIAWNRQQSRQRITEEWASAGFANALGNTLYRRLVQDYMDPLDMYGIDLVCPPFEPHRVALKDFRTHQIIRVGYLSDLTAVDPEQEDWPEIAAPTDEVANIAAVQFGGLISVTRKTIINDDLGLVAKVAARAGRAARRTMARRLWNLAINNGNIYDGVAFFASGHNNLGTTALAAAELANIRVAMRKQTEKNSGERIGVRPWILAVPPELESTAIVENERQYTDNAWTPNPVRFMFGQATKAGDPAVIEEMTDQQPKRIIVNPLLTDANDYYAFANPEELQTFELGFLQGKAEPELLLADNQLVGLAFTSDRVQYKIRHEYEVTVVDYRGAYKEVVA